MNTSTDIANHQSQIADGTGPTTKPKPKAKRSAAMSPKALKNFSWQLVQDWRRLDAASKTDYELKELADRLLALQGDLNKIACRRETREAESRDWKLGNPICWTVFMPDNLLGMKITTRTPNRIIEERVPTMMDLVGIAFLGKKSDLDRYKPQARPAHPTDYLSDLEREWHPYDWEKKYASVGARVDFVMAEWGKRFERAREQEAREREWDARNEVAA